MIIGSNNFNDVKIIFAAPQIESLRSVSVGCCDAARASTIPYANYQLITATAPPPPPPLYKR